MSRDERVESRQRPGIDPRDPYYHLSIVGHQAAADWARANRGVRTTASRIKTATESGALAYGLVSGKRAYSEADLDTFLLSLRRTAERKQVTA